MQYGLYHMNYSGNKVQPIKWLYHALVMLVWPDSSLKWQLPENKISFNESFDQLVSLRVKLSELSQ